MAGARKWSRRRKSICISMATFMRSRSAHNLLAALIDSHMFHGNELDLDPDAHHLAAHAGHERSRAAQHHISVTAPEKKQRDGSNRPVAF